MKQVHMLNLPSATKVVLDKFVRCNICRPLEVFITENKQFSARNGNVETKVDQACLIYRKPLWVFDSREVNRHGSRDERIQYTLTRTPHCTPRLHCPWRFDEPRVVSLEVHTRRISRVSSWTWKTTHKRAPETTPWSYSSSAQWESKQAQDRFGNPVKWICQLRATVR